MKAEGARRQRARRPAHHRHRAARSPPHRPAASRPLRPARRSRQQPLLPVARRRPDADLRRRVGQERAHPPRHAGRRGDRKPHGHAAASKAPRRRSKSGNFEVRKNLLEYDEVMDEQRKRVYGYRQRILDGVNCRDLIIEMIDKQVDAAHRTRSSSPTTAAESFAAAAGNMLHVQLDAKRFPQRRLRRRRADRRSTKPAAWPSRRCSTRSKRTCPTRTKTRANGTGRRWPHWPTPAGALNLPRPRPQEDRPRRARRVADRDGPRGDRRGRSVEAAPLPGAGLRRARRPAPGCSDKFGVELDARRSRASSSRRSSCDSPTSRPIAAYDERESEYPGAGRPVSLLRPRRRRPAAGLRPRRARRLGQAAVRRRAVDRRPQEQAARRNPRSCWSSTASENNEQANEVAAEAQQRVDAAVRRRAGADGDARRGHRPQRQARSTSPTGSSNTLQLRALQRRAGRARPRSGSSAACRRSSKITTAPRCGAWSGRCCCRSSTRPGKSTCWRWTTCAPASACAATPRSIPRSNTSAKACGCSSTMWSSVGNYVTDLIFKMEQLDEDFVGSTWVETARDPRRSARRDRARSNSSSRQTIAGTEADTKLEPIRNREPARRPQRPLPLRQRQEVQELLHAESAA